MEFVSILAQVPVGGYGSCLMPEIGLSNDQATILNAYKDLDQLKKMVIWRSIDLRSKTAWNGKVPLRKVEKLWDYRRCALTASSSHLADITSTFWIGRVGH